MAAWVEWQFFDPNSKIVKGKNFDCSKCPLAVQKTRGCNINSLNLTPTQAKNIPMQILSKGMKHTFCPSKLYRDYPDYVLYFETLFNSYKTSESLDKLGIEISQQTISDQNQLLRLYEQYIRIEQYDILGKMIGGSKEE